MRPRALFFAPVLLLTCIVAFSYQAAGQEPSPSLPGDAVTPPDQAPGGSANLWSHSDEADLVADVVLIKGISHVPDPLRIIVTDYVFQVNEAIKGDVPGKHLTVRNIGGEIKDTGMDTLHSFRLREGHRYLIFARKTPEGLELEHVLQVEKDGAGIADANGRLLVGLREGEPIVQPTGRVTGLFPSLRYVAAPALPARPVQGPPDKGSHPLPDKDGPPSADKADPLTLTRLKKALQTRLKEGKGEDLPPESTGHTLKSLDEPPFVLAGGYVSEPHNFYTYLANNNHWDWFQACGDNWNQLLDPSPSGRNWLVGFFRDKAGNPIRNEKPVANNNRNNLGVATSAEMTAGGYGTWESLKANGVCYRWYETTNGRIKEVDVLVNPAIAGNEAQYRKSLTHELGHALILDHEDRYFNLLYPGTWQQPPNYASLWYARQDDILGVRTRLIWVNDNIEPKQRWRLKNFADMATWSQYHSNPGSAGSLLMTGVNATSPKRGQKITFRNVHVENRGNLACTNVTLKFYFSWNPTVSSGDTEAASYTWKIFQPNSQWSGPLDVTVPSSLSPGTYYAGWVLTTSTGELTASNNTAVLLQDSAASFAPVKLTVK